MISNIKITDNEGRATKICELIKTDSTYTIILYSVRYCNPCLKLAAHVFSQNRSRLILINLGFQTGEKNYWQYEKERFPPSKKMYDGIAYSFQDTIRKREWLNLKSYYDLDFAITSKLDLKTMPYVYVVKNRRTVYFHKALVHDNLIKVIEGLAVN